ncbi:MAG: iron ABC transporter permease [Kineosporiaceae bacterium]|nr:iron ABC transporter permease [Kineosporiaceae bacterium]
MPAALAALIASIPLAYLVLRATANGLDPVLQVLWRERTARLVGRSILFAALVTLACLVVGIGTAWILARCRLRGAGAWRVLLALPLAVPSYVAAFSWLAIWPQLEGLWAAVLVLTLTSYPYAYLPVLAALRSTDPALEEVSRSLGRGRWRTFATVTLRQVSPAAAGGGLLVALYALSDFGAVSILRYDSFTRVIHSSYRAGFDRTQAAILGCLLVLVTIVIVIGESRARGHADRARTGSGVRRTAAPVELGWWMPAATVGLGGVLGLALGVPAVSLTWWLMRGGSAGTDLPSLATAALTTLWVSLLGAALTVALALPVGVLAARSRHRAVRVIEQLTYAGHALPGIVVALSLVLVGVTILRPLYQRTPLLVLAYAVLFLPSAVAAVRGSVVLSSPRLEEVARALGNSPRQVFRRVTLPLATPGIAAGAVLVMLTCMKELPATLLLRPTGTETLATELWAATTVGRYAEAAPYAGVLVLLSSLPAALMLTTRGDRRG